MLVGTAGVLTVGSLAGCLNGDEEPEEEPETEPEVETATVSFLVEGVGGHDHDHDHDDDHHDDDHHDDDHDHDDDGHALSSSDIDHACGHKEFDDPETLEAGSSVDDAPVVSATHQPFEVSIEGESGFVAFEPGDEDDHDHDHDDDHHDDHDHDDDHHDDHDHDDDHDHNHDHGDGDTYAFFTYEGSVSTAEGEELYDQQGVDECDLIDEYVVVELDHGRAVLELTAE